MFSAKVESDQEIDFGKEILNLRKKYNGLHSDKF